MCVGGRWGWMILSETRSQAAAEALERPQLCKQPGQAPGPILGVVPPPLLSPSHLPVSITPYSMPLSAFPCSASPFVSVTLSLCP